VKVSGSKGDLRGVDITVVDDRVVTRFGAYVDSTHMMAKGDMKLHLVVPYEQVPHVMPLMAEVGGLQFEITVRRVPVDQLPEPGW